MKTSSAKAKGRRFQQWVAQQIGLVLDIPVEKDGDIESRPMGQSGSDIILRGEARKRFPYGVECKNVESLSIWAALKQAEEYGFPLLFFTRNRTNRYVAMRAEEFFRLYKKSQDGLDRDDLPYSTYKEVTRRILNADKKSKRIQD